MVWWRARGRTAAGYGRETSFTWEVGIKRRDAPVDSAWGSIRDVDGDGYDDVFTSALVQGTTRFYLLRGSATGPRVDLQDYWLHPMGGYNLDMVAGDFNADGRTELLYSTFSASAAMFENLVVLRAWDATSLRLVEEVSLEGAADSTTAADVNGDGFQDWICDQETYLESMRRRAYRTYVVYGGESLGSGGITNIGESALGGGRRFVDARTSAFSVGDLNGDGYADILFADWFNASVQVLRGGPNGPEQTPSLVIRSPSSSSDSRFGWRVGFSGDVNGDQLVDFTLWTANWRQVQLYLGDRERMARADAVIRNPDENDRTRDGFPPWFGEKAGPGSDADGDGRAEIMIGCADCRRVGATQTEDGVLYVFRWTGTEQVELATSISSREITLGTSVYGIGDTNGDGFDDVGVGTFYVSNTLAVLFGSTSGLSIDRSDYLMGPAGRLPSEELSFGRFLARSRIRALRRM